VKRTHKLLLVSLISAALIATACGDSGETATTTTVGSSATAGGPTTTVKNTASDTGVTETTIKIAIHSADLSGLVKAGAIKGVPEDAHTANSKRITYYLDKWNAEGGINGRKFESVIITWDPADPKSYQTSCQKIIDAKVFMVIAAGGGFPPDSTPCITVDGKTQYLGIDAVSPKQFKEMGANFINLAPPGAASAQAGIELLVKNATLLPKTAKVAVLRSDWDFSTEAYNEVDKVLKREGYTVVFSEAIKTANLPTTDANKNVALAVEKVKSGGATHVVSMLNFTNFGVFPPEATKAGLTLKYSMLEISSGMCTAFSAGQLPPEMEGAPCITHWNNFRLDTAGAKATDTPFEATCRADFEATYKTTPVGSGFPVITKTTPGVPYPGFKDATGKQLDMDQSYYECNLMNIVKVGITGAGGNLTKKTFQDAIFKQKDFDAAGIAGGKGTLAANKLWLASNVQQVVVTAKPTSTFADPVDANGLYGGKCLSPLSCFRTVPNTVAALTYTLS
jgi:ABC-type branched-subunit amino acid transport system substrate-binding protein